MGRPASLPEVLHELYCWCCQESIVVLGKEGGAVDSCSCSWQESIVVVEHREECWQLQIQAADASCFCLVSGAAEAA
jgi:hypothetical protein